MLQLIDIGETQQIAESAKSNYKSYCNVTDISKWNMLQALQFMSIKEIL